MLCPLIALTVSLSNAEPTLSVDQITEDFKVMRDSLEEGHPGLYRYTSKPQMDRWFDGVARTLDHPMALSKLYRKLAPVLAKIKCGHTAVLWPSDLLKERRASSGLLPMQVFCTKGRSFISKDASGQNLAGAEILSINGRAAGSILATLSECVSRDGNAVSAVSYRLSHGFGYARLLDLVAGISGPFKLELNRAGKKEAVTVTGRLLDQLSGQSQPSSHTGDLTFLDNGAVGVLKITGFGGTGGAQDKPLADWYGDAFQELADHKAGTLIIDVRDNGGGEDELGRMLYAHLANEPFDYYRHLYILKPKYDFAKYVLDRESSSAMGQAPEGFEDVDGKLTFVKHPNWGRQSPLQLHFGGRVIVLENGGSFSTTGEFMSITKEHRRATFVGEESAAAFGGNNSGFVPTVTLPNSKIRVVVPMLRYDMAVTGKLDRGIMPDVPVDLTIDDLLSGKDREMDVALRLARR